MDRACPSASELQILLLSQVLPLRVIEGYQREARARLPEVLLSIDIANIDQSIWQLIQLKRV